MIGYAYLIAMYVAIWLALIVVAIVLGWYKSARTRITLFLLAFASVPVYVFVKEWSTQYTIQKNYREREDQVASAAEAEAKAAFSNLCVSRQSRTVLRQVRQADRAGIVLIEEDRASGLRLWQTPPCYLQSGDAGCVQPNLAFQEINTGPAWAPEYSRIRRDAKKYENAEKSLATYALRVRGPESVSPLVSRYHFEVSDLRTQEQLGRTSAFVLELRSGPSECPPIAPELAGLLQQVFPR
jgi:hypothetical protein